MAVADATWFISLSLGKQVLKFCNKMSTRRANQGEVNVDVPFPSVGGDFAAFHSTSLRQPALSG